MTPWRVQDAKARFSELLELSIISGPQLVTKRGAAAAVLVSITEWQALQARARRTLKEVLLDPSGPKFDGLELPTRGTNTWRRVGFGVSA
jgi:antitoxin Phd